MKIKSAWSITMGVSTSILMLLLSGCATHNHSTQRTAWVKEIQPGKALVQQRRDGVTCLASKSQTEIDSTNWALVAFSHIRSVKYRWLPLERDISPSVGDRVTVDIHNCKIVRLIDKERIQ